MLELLLQKSDGQRQLALSEVCCYQLSLPITRLGLGLTLGMTQFGQFAKSWLYPSTNIQAPVRRR
jgi:hypothetical protein